MKFTYDDKDARWRWLLEVGDFVQAGEEYKLTDAVRKCGAVVIENEEKYGAR